MIISSLDASTSSAFPEEERNRDKIEKTLQLIQQAIPDSFALPPDFSLTPLQKAVILGDLVACERIWRESPNEENEINIKDLFKLLSNSKKKFNQVLIEQERKFLSSALFFSTFVDSEEVLIWCFERASLMQQARLICGFLNAVPSKFLKVYRYVKDPIVFKLALGGCNYNEATKSNCKLAWEQLTAKLRRELLEIVFLEKEETSFVFLWDLCSKEEKNLRNQNEDTWLHRAIRYSEFSIVEKILEEDPWLVKTVNNRLYTPLDIAIVNVGFDQDLLEELRDIDHNFTKKVNEYKLWGQRHDLGLVFTGWHIKREDQVLQSLRGSVQVFKQ